MNVERLLNEPCIIATRTASDTRDEYNDPVDVTSYAASTCWLWQGTGQGRGDQSEAVSVGNIIGETYTYCFPGDVVLSERDAVILGPDPVMAPLVVKAKAGTLTDEDIEDAVGLLSREVLGTPWSATHPRTRRVEFVVATLKRAG